MIAVTARLPATDDGHPAIVLVHGAANSAVVWTYWQQALASEGWASYAIDLQGHGASDPLDLSNTSMHDYAADVGRLVAQIRQRPILIGWSMGGLVAMMAAETGDVAACVGLAPSMPARTVAISGRVRDATGLFQLGLTTMIVSHVTFQIPFVAIVVRSRLVGMDPAIEEASHDLGATSWQTFRHVTFPLTLPPIVAGAMLAFTLSLDDFVVSFFTTGPGATTLPILIYSSVKRGITPDINALSTLIVLASIVGTFAVALLERPRRTQGGPR